MEKGLLIMEINGYIYYVFNNFKNKSEIKSMISTIDKKLQYVGTVFDLPYDKLFEKKFDISNFCFYLYKNYKIVKNDDVLSKDYLLLKNNSILSYFLSKNIFINDLMVSNSELESEMVIILTNPIFYEKI